MNSVLFGAIDWVLAIIEYAILIRVIISWLPIGRENQLIQLLYQFTEPILAPIRHMVERSSFARNMMFDISPIIAILLVGLVRNIVGGILF